MITQIRKNLSYFKTICHNNLTLLRKRQEIILLLKVVRLIKNPRWHLMRLLSRFHYGRIYLKYLSVFLDNSYSKPDSKPKNCENTSEICTLFPEIDIESVVSGLKRDGLYLGINLPPNIVEAVISFANTQPCFGNRDPRYGFSLSQRKIAEGYYGLKFPLAGYYNSAMLCPEINSLQNDPKFLAIAERYFGCKAVHISTMLWWSFAEEITDQQKARAFQMFHYDFDDFAFIKFFFYFTNVGLLDGPHVCICGSHKNKKLSHILFPKQETDKEIISYYGKEKMMIICGDPGFGFVEDTFCFHKGTTPVNQDRLIMQVEFAVTDYGMQHDILDSSLLHVM